MEDSKIPNAHFDSLRKANAREAERLVIFAILKTKINELLHCNLPPECTIGRMEDIACEMQKLIDDEWNKKR